MGRDARGVRVGGGEPAFDLTILGAEVAPGDGPVRRLDVGVSDGRIVALEPDLTGAGSRERIDGRGRLLTPGFIDMHAHSALAPFDDPWLRPKVAQGFTTELILPDGLAPAPVARERREERRASLRPLEGPGPERWTWSGLGEFLDALDATRPATGLVPSIGHNAVRDLVMGTAARPARTDEVRAMRREIAAGFEAGARSLSLGLFYLPGTFATTVEVTAVCREAAPHAAPVAVHVRNEADGVLTAVDEMIRAARAAGAPLHLSHLKVLGHPHLVGPLLERLDAASHEQPISFDQYPYGAGSTSMVALLPPWAQAGDAAEIVARLRDPADRARLRRDVSDGIDGWENSLSNLGPDAITLANASGDRAGDVGRTLADLAAEADADPVDALCDLLIDTGVDATMVHRYASEDAVREILRHPLHTVGSDGIFGARPHPRLYGSAARFLGRYVLRERVLPLSEGVARLTSTPARLLGLRDRGRVAPGLRADLVLLDPTRFVDRATYEAPAQVPDGVEGVWVAGRLAWNGRRVGPDRAGGVVRWGGYGPARRDAARGEREGPP